MMIPFFAFMLAAMDADFVQLRQQDARVATIAWRLQTANASLCPNVDLLAGLSLEALSLYPRDRRSAAKAQLGLRDRVAISAIAKGGAAEGAGLAIGDAIIAVGDAETPIIADDETGYGAVSIVEDRLAEPLQSGPVIVRTERNGSARLVKLVGVKGCASIMQIVPGRRLNAQADGRYVQINSAMLAFVHTDDELAALAAHELAHNILRHRAKNTASKQAEYEADRLSAWLVARSGYDVDAIVPFWTRLEQRTTLGIFADGSHPSPRQRIAALVQAIAVVKAQRAAGQDLVPPAQ